MAAGEGGNRSVRNRELFLGGGDKPTEGDEIRVRKRHRPISKGIRSQRRGLKDFRNTVWETGRPSMTTKDSEQEQKIGSRRAGITEGCNWREWTSVRVSKGNGKVREGACGRADPSTAGVTGHTPLGENILPPV